MRIKKLTLKNFQAYEKVEFEFDSDFNCIVGPTSVGKTVVVRALQFLFYNEWDSDFVRRKADSAYICVEFDNGVIVEREKGLAVNRLIVSKDGQKKTYENFGFDLPQDVLDLLGVSPVVIDGRKFFLNIADQDETYFLLMDSGIVKSKMLCRLANLDTIDKALTEANRLKRAHQSQKIQCEKDILDLNYRLEKYTDLDKQVEKFKVAESLLNEIVKQDSELTNLVDCKRKLSSNASEIEVLNKELTFLQQVNVDFLLGKINEFLDLKRVRKDLDSLADSESSLVNQLSQIKRDLQSCKDELLKLGKCPLCLSTLDEVQIQKIAGE